LHRNGMVMPEPFDGLVVNAVIQFVPDNPGQCAIPKAVVEGCDRAIPNPNRLVKSFAYKINCLLKNIVWLYKPSSHANVLDAGP
jgi:hypothetical protein